MAMGCEYCCTDDASSSASSVQQYSHIDQQQQQHLNNIPPPPLSTTSFTSTTTLTDTIGKASLSEIILPAIADATISDLRPNNNFGSHSAIVVDGGDYSTSASYDSYDGERFDSILKFDTSLLDYQTRNTIESVALKLYAMGGCDSGGSIYATDDNLWWDEQLVTWNSAPPIFGNVIGTLGSIVSGQWYSVDVSSMVNGWGKGFSSSSITLRMQSSSSSRCLYSSVEYGDATAPRLVVKYGPDVQQSHVIAQNEAVFATPYQDPSISTMEEATTMMTPTQELIPVAGNFILLIATDDATIDAFSSSNSNSNDNNEHFGNSPTLSIMQDVESRTIQDCIIRFDLAQMHYKVPRSALLTLFTESDCDSAGTFKTVGGEENEESDTTIGDWSEGKVTWSTAPTIIYNEIGTFGAVTSGQWYGFSVVDALNEAVQSKRDSITFRLSSGNRKSCSFASIQSGLPPKLLVAF